MKYYADHYGGGAPKHVDFDPLRSTAYMHSWRSPASGSVRLRAPRRASEGGARLFVMSHRVDHCRAIDARYVSCGIGSGLMLGGQDNDVEAERTLAGMDDGTRRVAVGTYQAIGTGLDVPAVEAVVCATPIAGNRQFFNQVKGRACRKSATPAKAYACM